MAIKTRFTQLLGIQYPIVCPAMSLVMDHKLVAAACNAGALGILPSGEISPETLRVEVQKVKELVGNKPFGVAFSPARPGVKRYVQVLIDEKVPVWTSAFRDPFKMFGIKKSTNLIYIPVIGSPRQAVSMEKVGADAVMVLGWEGGGHPGPIASTVLIPKTVESVKIPVIGAGGFMDGRGLVAALALGAEGVAMGTRLALTQESLIVGSVKEYYLKSKEDDAIISNGVDGIRARHIRGAKVKNYRGWWTHFWDVPPYFFSTMKVYDAKFGEMIEIAKFLRKMRVPLLQFLCGMEMNRRGMREGDLKRGVFCAGQVIGRIEDIPTCAQVIEQTAKEAEQIIQGLNKKLVA